MKPYSMDDAEADLHNAIRADDTDEATRLGHLVDKLDEAERGTRSIATLHQSALYYASCGLKVFPLSPGTKIPFKGSRGCLDATTDPDRINAWWTATPDANLGIATGHLVDVVDVDGVVGQKSRAEHWDNVFARIDSDSIGKVLTPRAGGMHLYVPATGQGNAASIVPSVDYRGAGGYVVAPPSRTDVGAYRWLGTPDLAALAVAGDAA